MALLTLVRKEWFLGAALLISAVFLSAGHWSLALFATPVGMALQFAVLFTVILGSALAVVRHAERLSEMIGDPYGTLILTVSVAFIEVVSISAVVLHGESNPTLVRDSLLSVVMIVLNGMVGASLLIGGWRHREQSYNLQGANAYLGVIIPLVVMSLVMPSFTYTTSEPTLSRAQGVFVIVMSIALYGAFLAIQTGRHRGYFVAHEESPIHADPAESRPIARHGLLLVAYLVPVVLLAEQLAEPIDYLIETLHAPTAFGGIALALLVATPEAIGAVRAAIDNHLQRAVNIFLGSVLATIGLTIPAMLVVSDLAGLDMILGIRGTDLIMLLLTLAVSVVTFSSGRTNILQGAVHLLLFIAYLLLMFQG